METVAIVPDPKASSSGKKIHDDVETQRPMTEMGGNCPAQQRLR